MKRIERIKKTILVGLSLYALSTFAQITTYSYTGGPQTYTVPAGVTLIQIEVAGGEGGEGDGGSGGMGATMIGTFEVSPGDVLEVVVGGAGEFGGAGGGGYSGGGGGQYVDPSLDNRGAVAVVLSIQV